MTDTSLVHGITLAFKDPVPESVEAGVNFSLTVTVSSEAGCDLSGTPFKIVALDNTVVSGELPRLSEDNRDSAEITVAAPEQIGEFEWTLVLPAHEAAGICYREAALTFSFRTNPHATSLAVWDNPSPIVVGETFRVKVGAKCSAACALKGKEIEIHDDTGAVVATAALGETPWEGTTALYWTSVEMAVPTDQGSFSWSVRFSGAELRLPHGGASASFSFLAVTRPEHEVFVRIVEKDTADPLPNAQVRLGVYRATTDDRGLARFAVSAGTHTLYVWKAGYEAPARTVDVSQDAHVQVEAAAFPEEKPFAFWQG